MSPSSEDVADASNQPHSLARQVEEKQQPVVGATVLRGSQSEPLPALLFLRSSHSDDWLPQLFGSVQHLFVSTKSPFLLSTSSCFCRRWTCDRAWDRREHSTTSRQRNPFPLGAAPMAQHNASGIKPAIGCWYTSLLPVLSCPPWEGNVVRCVLTGDTRLAVQHRPRREDERREDDGIGHQNDELLRRQPAHVAHRQPEEPYPRNLKSSA